MCGIIVATSDSEKLREGLVKTNHRGPDATRIVKHKGGIFMFNRLSIIGLDDFGMQPFTYNENILVANAEIYNYKQIKNELNNEYTFKGESDCEILLPLYEQVGIEMFELLDAEFACVLYDHKKKSLVAGRDPLGIRPLFYGYSKEDDTIVFSSEVKGIIDVVTKVYPFPPGHYYIHDKFIRYSFITEVDEFHDDTFDVILENIRYKLRDGVRKRLVSDAPMGFLLSGGLDSSLVCSIAAKYTDVPIRTFSIGMAEDAIDLKYAKIVSKYLKTEHTEVIITKEDVLETLEHVIYTLETYDITTIRASIGMYLVAKYIHEKTDIKVLQTGEISDELFGYKYTDFAPDPDAFQAEAIKRIDEIHMYDVLRADRTLAANSLEARVPFGDLDFVNYVMRIPPVFKMNKYKMGKFLLRKAFEDGFLPHEILYRDKAAFSDAVGHSMVDYLKEYANNMYTNDEFNKKTQNYKTVQPFTKESLLYREIFDKYYPNHVHLVKDYWMPNVEWEGCNVDDPSARVLSNYGDSGK